MHSYDNAIFIICLFNTLNLCFLLRRGRSIIRKVLIAQAKKMNAVCCRRELLKILSANA